MDEDALRAMFPTGFSAGKAVKVVKTDTSKVFEDSKRKDREEIPPPKPILVVEKDEDDAESDDDDIGPPIPGATKKTEATLDSDSSSDSSSDDEPEDETLNLPISHEISLKDHYKSVSSLSLDPSGVRLLTGSYDYTVKFWDFTGMDASLRPFRGLQPCRDNPVRDVQWSPSGDQFLVCSSSAQITNMKLFNRDGIELQEYGRGDMYIRDLKHTKGHTAALNSLRWHPTEKETFASTSSDSTVRIWSVNEKRKQKEVIVVKSGAKANRVSVVSSAYNHQGNLLGCGSSDGVVRIYASKGPYSRPAYEIQAHGASSEVTSIEFSLLNTNQFVSRGMDDTCKIFDIRNPSLPLAFASGLYTSHSEQNAVFSPDEKYVVTGRALTKGEADGALVILKRSTMEIIDELTLSTASPLRVLWHSRINQVFVGCSDGSARVFYDPNMSVNGAKLPLVRRVKQAAESTVHIGDVSSQIMTPNARPELRNGQQRMSKRRQNKIAKDPVATKRPALPMKGHGKGGRVGMNVTQQFMKPFIDKDNTRDEDPREAILKHAAEAAANPYWIAPAYQKSQPKTVFEHDVEDEEHDERVKEVKRRKLDK